VTLGLLRRMRSGTDTRAWRLHLTSTGQAALRTSRESFASINARIEREFSQQEIEQLAGLLDRLTTAFED
jgi:DNA-binding MarR family transcriptional regulator